MKLRSIRYLSIITIFSIILSSFFLNRWFVSNDYHQLELSLHDYTLAQITLIESVTSFDKEFSKTDYGSSSRDATLYQIAKHVKNLGIITNHNHIAIVDLDDNLIIAATSNRFFNLDKKTHNGLWLDEILTNLESSKHTTKYYGSQDDMYLTESYYIKGLNIGIISYVNVRDYLGIRTYFSSIGLIFTMLILTILYLLYRINTKRYIRELDKTKQMINQFNRFKGSGIWHINFKEDSITIPDDFFQTLGYDHLKIGNIHDYFEYINPEDIQSVKGRIKDIEYGYDEHISFSYRLSDVDGAYHYVVSEFFVEEKNNDGIATKLAVITTLIER